MKQTWMLVAATFCCLLFVNTGNGQSGQRGQQSPGNSAAPSGASSSGLPGLSYELSSWRDHLTLPPLPARKRVVACYKLVYGNSSSQPFVLQPVQPSYDKKTNPANQPDDWRAFYRYCPDKNSAAATDPQEIGWCKGHPAPPDDGKEHFDLAWTPCTPLDDKHPPEMGQTLVVAIDASEVNEERFKILNFNVTNAQGNPINATPVRPSFTNSGSGTTNALLFVGGEDKAKAQYYLSWPNLLPGDVIPTVSVNLVVTSPVQGEIWSKDTYYPVGSVVTPYPTNGHYYAAIRSGVSGDAQPTFPVLAPVSVLDGTGVWVDSGSTTAPTGGSKVPGIWLPKHQYSQGDQITDPYNGHTYTSMSDKLTSSDLDPKTLDPFSLPTPSAGVQQTAQQPQEVREGGILWKKVACVSSPPNWRTGYTYSKDAIVVSTGGACYQASADGQSGAIPIQPYFPFASVAPVQDQGSRGALFWQDLGTTSPASVTGAQATDQTVSLLNQQLPQSHTLSYYNLAAGVVYSTVHSRTFSVPPGITSTSGQLQTSSSPTVDPVLLFTAYPWPVDAESRCGFGCIIKTAPGVSGGLSLASPSTSFYVGASFELLRNVQLVVGNNWAKVARLPNPPVKIPANATTATTVQRFSAGGFWGLTFNISGFIQGLFGGGGGGGGGSSKGSTPSQ